MIKLLLADDHNIILDGLTQMFASNDNINVVSTANNGKEVLDKLNLASFDVILLDINMPIMNGIECAQEVLKLNPNQKIIMLTMNEEKSIIEKMISVGVKGFLLKTTEKEELENAIKMVHTGKEYFSSSITKIMMSANTGSKPASNLEILSTLTEREIEIIKYIAEGFSSAEIGEKLFISPRTVETHRTNIMKKIEVNNVAGMVRFAFQNKLV